MRRDVNRQTVAVNAGAMFSVILWAMAIPVAKFVLDAVSPLRLAGLRLSISAVILLFLQKGNPFRGTRGYAKWIVVFAFLQTVCTFGLSMLALSMVPGSLVAAVNGAGPAVAVIVAVLFLPEEKLTSRKAWSLVFGMAGTLVVVLSRDPWTAAGKTEMFGAFLLLLGLLSAAYSIIVLKQKLKTLPIMQVNFLQISIGAFVLFAISFVIEPVSSSPFVYAPSVWGEVVFLGSVTAIADTLWLYLLGLPDVRISTISIWKFLVPVLGASMSWFLLPDDSPAWGTVAGTAAIALSVLMTVNDGKHGALRKEKCYHGKKGFVTHEKHYEQ